MERREATSGALRRLAMALIVLAIQAIFIGSCGWGIARILVSEDVLPRWISWQSSCQIVFFGMLLKVVWMIAHGRGGGDE